MGVKVREKSKGSGEWWIFIDHQGTRKAKKIGKDKRVALEVAKKVEAKLTLGDMKLLEEEKERIGSFKDYAENWMSLTVSTTCKPSTQVDYRSILDNHILPVFGSKEITSINRLMIKNFLMGKIKQEFASSTVSHMKSCISGILNLAVDDGIITSNPAHRLGKLFIKKENHNDINPYTKEEVLALMSNFQKLYPDHYPLILTLARTGMRFGEALALKWNDIDFENRFIKIQRTFARGKLGQPKNGKSRLIDMSNQLSQVLKELNHHRKDEMQEIPEWVFINGVGNPLDDNHWRKQVFYKVIKKSGLRKIRIHDFASLLIQAGESLAYIRDQLGHHSIKVTVDIYGHLTPGGNKAAVDRLDE
ncbi:MAG: site-specific integrase [Desulfobacterales bacterium]|nr:site-specific integrase [Desulfobacterales bacterium]